MAADRPLKELPLVEAAISDRDSPGIVIRGRPAWGRVGWPTRLSSREVAEQLKLSVRTVERHVYRAMTKTGTTSRQELAALLSLRDDKTP